ncbi:MULTISPECIES: triacylglycerol lipase [unclassified Streptomyces]|uniref:esterase/lipase family protein n=1 Tax=unclassified Streptomyces TaxID=2593676 RepID=UPI0022548C0D|nr:MULTISPECIES: alpha/beta fold hydrolase [unclassified Streptomyces]MCX4527625.1 alpha/beta fold hydrolase [Streptomyces sp. NBC_01551]MCX4541777.1 alpha/beta fold hydrolase [Streptomyces sp. NBC_01565]
MGLSITPLLTVSQSVAPSGAVVRAAVLEALVFAGHLLLYPTGVLSERPPTGPAGPRPPVLLLHGFSDNRSVFVLLRRALGAGGRRHVETYNYSPFTRDLRVTARHLARRVEELCERTGQDRVDLVGHSLGGLVGRYYVQRLGGDTRVRTLVTLGTPHSGTRVAPFMDAHPLVRQMRPDSAVMAELRAPAPGCRTRCVAFWSELDAIMAPAGTARLEHPDLHAENIQVTGIGHLALPAHPAVIAAVRRALDGRPGELGEVSAPQPGTWSSESA